MLVLLMVVGTVCLTSPPAAAHSPHDDVFAVAMSPQFGSDHTMVTVSRGLLLRSDDAGASWQRLVRGLDNRRSFFDVAYAGNASTLYAVSEDAAFRSTDGGASWVRALTAAADDLDLVAASPASATAALVAGPTAGARITNNGGASWTALGATTARLTAAAYGRTRVQDVLVGDENGVLHVSANGGQSWTHRSLGAVGAVTSISPSPTFATDGLVLVGTDGGGVIRWNERTATRAPLLTGLTDRRVTSVAHSARYPSDDTLFASTWDTGTFVSTDDGATWDPATTGLHKDAQADEARFARPHFGELATATMDPAGLEPVVMLGSFTGIYTSIDQAQTWEEVGHTQSPAIIEGLALSPGFASDGRMAVTTYVNGPRTSSDRGTTWRPSNVGLAQTNYWSLAEDSYLRGFNVAFAPTVRGRQWMFLASDPGVYRSSDGGATWHLTPVPGFANPRDSTAAVAPRMFVSPSFATDRTVLMVDTGAGDVYRSTNRGASFQKVGRVPNSVHCLQAAPTFATDGRLLACTGNGVFVSTNLGTTWAATERLVMYDLAVAVTGGEETWFAATLNGLHRSTDRGQTWAHVALPAPASGAPPIGAVAASPATGSPATVLVSTKGKGMFRSTDGGDTFSQVGASLLTANEQFHTYPYRNTGSPIVFSPAFSSDRTVFGYSHTSLFRSTDGGVTWQRLTLPYARHSGERPVLPGAPTGVTAVAGHERAEVSWSEPAAVGSSPIRRYVVRPLVGYYELPSTTFDSPATTQTIAGLEDGRSYRFKVAAVNDAGQGPWSDASGLVTPGPVAPDAPPAPTASARDDGASVSWAAPADDGGSPITGYVVTPYEGYVALPSRTFGPSARTRLITGLTPGRTYRFKVEAVNALGTSGPSDASNPVVPT